MAERREVHVATGKRKSAVARIRMSIGEGRLVVNERTLEDYFGAKHRE
jgi:small subunit ribosomal protein S9